MSALEKDYSWEFGCDEVYEEEAEEEHRNEDETPRLPWNYERDYRDHR